MIKRSIDIIVSATALMILLPFILLLCLVIWHKPIYTQERYGKGRRIFTLYKIRTMNIPNPNDNRKIEDLQRDRRVTKIGKVLRAFHLDELPQLVNILKGDMSIVGPRPIPVIMKTEGLLNWEKRNAVRPGVTGLAQLYCTKYTTLVRKFRFDVLYVKKQSLWLDIKLILATSRRVMPLVAFVLCTIGILLATLLPIPEESIPGTGLLWQADKFAHFGMFMVWAIAAYWFLRSFVREWPNLLFILFCAGGVLAWSTEFAQKFIPLRNSSPLDYFADMVGILYVMLLLILGRKKGLCKNAVS